MKRSVVSKIERGVNNPTLEILLRLANLFDIYVGQLLSSHGKKFVSDWAQ